MRKGGAFRDNPEQMHEHCADPSSVLAISRERAIQAATTTSPNARSESKGLATRHDGRRWRSITTLRTCWMISPRLALAMKLRMETVISRGVSASHKHLVKLFSRTAQLPWGVSDAREKSDHLWSPQEVRQYDRIDVRIYPGRADRMQLYPTAVALHHLDHAAPAWNACHYFWQVPLSCDDRYLLKGLSIHFDL